MRPRHGSRVCPRKTNPNFNSCKNKIVRYLLTLSLQNTYWGRVKMLPFEYRVNQLKLHNMLNIIHGTAQCYLSSRIMTDQHSIGTRSSVLAVVVPYVHGPGTSTIAFTAAWKVWNALRLNIHSIQSPRSFRKAVRDVFFTPFLYANPFLYC